jgi:hypothetical protein
MAKKKVEKVSEETKEDFKETAKVVTPEIVDSSDASENDFENQKKNIMSDKSTQELYKEVESAKYKPFFQGKLEENKKAMDGKEGFKKQVITLANSNTSIPFEQIDSSKAFSIKKYGLYFMFDLSEEQIKFLKDKPLQWFAAKKING